MRWSILLVVALVTLSSVLAASGKATPRPFKLSDKAVQVAPGVYHLGTVQHEGKPADGYAFVHYARGGGAAKPPRETCYAFLARGAKWKSAEPWMVNPANDRGLAPDAVLSTMIKSVATWEAGAGKDILGAGSRTDETLIADQSSTDGKNEIYFGPIDGSNTIAITIVWGYFSGPTLTRELLEWDQIYDDSKYDWSIASAGVSGKMDFQNIATHELGHSVGLSDLYTSACTAQTMYGYANYNEISKRDLASGDIAGIKALYS